MFAASMPFLGAAAGAIGSFFGQKSANDANREIADQANAFSARQAQMNRDWQERMANTSWQRGVADMRAAGINPMLAFSKGGADTPGGSSASGTVGNPQQNALSGLANSAIQATTLKATLDNLKAQNRQIDSQTALNLANANTAKVQAKSIAAGTPVKQTESEFAKDLSTGYHNAKSVASSIGRWIGNNLPIYMHGYNPNAPTTVKR